MKRKNVMITEKQEARVKAEADSQGTSFSELLRKIIDWYFSQIHKSASGEK